jgi:antitoxin ParD1/3/4
MFIALDKGFSSMATMNVSLPDDMAEFVSKEIAAGGYSSASEVVRDALRLLQHDKAAEQEKLAILRREVAIGLDAATSGRFSTRTVDEIADQVWREHFGE